MAGTNLKDINLLDEVALSQSDQDKLISYKTDLAKNLPESLVSDPAHFSGDREKLLEVNSDPLSKNFTYIIDNYVLNEEMRAQHPELEELYVKYNELPESIHTLTDDNETLFEKPTSPEQQREQQDAILRIAEKHLGTNDTNDSTALYTDGGELEIDLETSHAIWTRLDDLKKDGKLSENIDFDARIFHKDPNALKSLNEYVEKLSTEAGVKPDDLNILMLQYWSLHSNTISDDTGANSEVSKGLFDLSEAVSLRNIVGLALNGQTTSGFTASTPNTNTDWESQWTNNDSGDRFFNASTYKSLLNGDTVSRSNLFDKDSYNPENYKQLMEAADEAGIDAFDEGDLTKEEIGKIAGELLTIKAEAAWCFIDPDKKYGEEFDKGNIFEAISDMKFCPHTDDCYLVKIGYGNDPDNLTASPVQVSAYQTEQFQKDFGGMSDETLERMKGMYPNHTPEDAAINVKRIYGTPSDLFGSYRSILGSTKPTQYEINRDEWLEDYQKFLDDGASCDSADPDVKCGGGPTCDEFQKQATHAAGNEQCIDESKAECNVSDTADNNPGKMRAFEKELPDGEELDPMKLYRDKNEMDPTPMSL